MSKVKSAKNSPSSLNDDEIVKLAREARVRASKLSDAEAEESFEKAMQIIYGGAAPDPKVGPRH
jgi:hypothetical protein